MPTANTIDAASTEAVIFSPRKPIVFRRFDPTSIVGWMSFDEYIVLEQRSKLRYDYVEGRVITVPGGSLEHSKIGANIVAALVNALTNTECDVYNSDQRVRIDARNYRYPDASVSCGDALSDPHDSLQNPVLIVEVLSLTTEREDRTDKFQDYQRIESLRHYILIDQQRPRVTHFEKLAQGVWAIVGMYRDVSEAIMLTLGDNAVVIPLAAIYRRITFIEEGKETEPTSD